MLTSPHYQITETTLTELIGQDEQVDQNDYGGSVAVTLGDGVRPVSGEFLSFMLAAFEDGTGAVMTPAGTLLLLDADPAVAAGDTALTFGVHVSVIGMVKVLAGDWISDANGAIAFIHDVPVPFHNLQTIYAVWFHQDATSFNDAGGDDEYLAFNAWYRRDS